MRFEERLKVKWISIKIPWNNPFLHDAAKTWWKTPSNTASANSLMVGRSASLPVSNEHLELSVQNTGHAGMAINGEGFGIKSTQDQLN